MAMKHITTNRSSREDAESEALFLSIGEGAIVTDQHGNISRINGIALQMLGLSSEDIIGKWYPSVIQAEDKEGNKIPNMERPIMEVFLSGKPIFRRVYYQKSDGTRMPVGVTVSPVIVRDIPIGAIEVFRDITEEVELENAKDEFISIASHQLRTPATVVKQYLGMMLEGYTGKLDSQQQEMLQTAYEYNDNQLDVINDLLKVAQADANQVRVVQKRVDIVELVRDVVEGQQAEHLKGESKIRLTPQTESVFCKVDPLHIRMVLENLLDNARKYTPGASSVTVEIVLSPQNVKVLVSDKGIGIAAEDIPKLFQKFSRVHGSLSSVGGTGLGLYWAKKLVMLHDGNISVTSKPDVGSTFTLELPRGDY
ncbi:PAS domain-containing sensor histidine kinase [Candidatus Saccharibacteria bacterium]|nr:PAS domain-containing sensor histidine kinase [Candidatus Saccharibacteria bacterium]